MTVGLKKEKKIKVHIDNTENRDFAWMVFVAV